MKKILKAGLRCLSVCLVLAASDFGQKSNSSVAPCENAEARAFEFQIGVWQTADGKITHEIKKIPGGCGVQEIWEKDGKVTAFALKSFDLGLHNAKGEQKWFYSWTAAGFHQFWEGRKENGGWRFYRQWTLEGQTILSRTYWNQLADGSIDRIVEQSRDGGRSWKPHVKDNFLKKQIK